MDNVETFIKDTKEIVTELRVDGGSSKNRYLMQFQSDLLSTRVSVSQAEEMSGICVCHFLKAAPLVPEAALRQC